MYFVADGVPDAAVTVDFAPVPPFPTPDIDVFGTDFAGERDAFLDLFGTHRAVLFFDGQFFGVDWTPWFELKFVYEYIGVGGLFDNPSA